MNAVTYLSKSAFAAHIGRSPSYITWLKENGRLVLSSNGKQVDVLATEALIRETADPSKAAVAARHQQERLQRDVYSHVAAQSEPTNMAAPPPADPAQGQTPDFQKARAHREHYLARMAEMEFRKAQGELVEISFVQKAAFETARSLNRSLMSISPQLLPQL